MASEPGRAGSAGSAGRRRPGPAGGSGGRRRGGVDSARLAAYDVVHAVSVRNAYANLVLPSVLRERGLSGRDAAFATELAHGTLRRGGYDDVLARCVNRPLTKLDPEVRDVLRLGAHQILGMRVPSHAAVATSVDLARRVAGIGPSKFVNAVLRKVAAHDLPGWQAELAPAYEQDPIGNLAAVHAHPRWVVEAFADALGGSLAETAAVLAADNEPARVTLAAWPGRSSVADLRAEGAEPGRWSPYAVVLTEGGDPHRVQAVAQGRAGVQDEGSQLVAAALAEAPLTGDGGDDRWLDLCAGPGGKSALLASLAGRRSAALLATELQPHRAELVARTLTPRGRRSRGVLGTVVADGTVPAWRPGAFDRVLADVPCTGLGALRRRPEARWRRAAGDVAGLTPLQGKLLTTALDSVRVGGVVAYVTCSPHLAETRDVVAGVLADRTDVERVDARPLLPGVPDLGDGPEVQLWPHRHGTDAMFLALLRRTGIRTDSGTRTGTGAPSQ
ncbi:RsmB/NOP family class I SAM-dependent RNA methyltransferase [Actinopolymorpha singaporensis]|uniref:16S rRNA (Cytosine967-C5)-methyltransferase n=1 Tax=Actinopolymorpha singaporensis TaxID=117157 RepID=A0A1H1VMT2_9ACTN|nr:transcription antitermination factor NusB [Actinopolymorpha singaporensis]SDS85586.1 16S rRNA (cytosine967-C5)-methyltransferase [Actinopolymorpha singaporensis]